MSPIRSHVGDSPTPPKHAALPPTLDGLPPSAAFARDQPPAQPTVPHADSQPANRIKAGVLEDESVPGTPQDTEGKQSGLRGKAKGELDLEPHSRAHAQISPGRAWASDGYPDNELRLKPVISSVWLVQAITRASNRPSLDCLPSAGRGRRAGARTRTDTTGGAAASEQSQGLTPTRRR